MSGSWSNVYNGRMMRLFGGADDLPSWAAEESPRANLSERCAVGFAPSEYQPATAVISAMFLLFGVVYCIFGYRCFKAVMFLTGFLFASVIVYLICLSEDLLPLAGNAAVAVGAGILFGLITMLVQYVGLFMTGFHTGLFLGAALIVTLHSWWTEPSVWAIVGLLLISGLALAVMTLYFQKGLTILGTAVSGGAIIAATFDYFIEEFLMLAWFRDRLIRGATEELCWYSWAILAIWPSMAFIGMIIQWLVTGKGTYHQQMVPSVKSRNVNLNRVRSREARAEMKQKKYRYLYQVRTAHGDIISQEYVQSLQRKASPSGDNGTLQSDSTHATMLPSDATQLAPLTESEDETHHPFRPIDSENANSSREQQRAYRFEDVPFYSPSDLPASERHFP